MALSKPTGPPPTTSIFFFSSAGVILSSSSLPTKGLTVHLRAPENTASMQRVQPMQRRMLSVSLAPAFCPFRVSDTCAVDADHVASAFGY